MSESSDEHEVAMMAVDALREAQRIAEATGPVVVVIDDKLVKKYPDGTIEFIKDMPPRVKLENLPDWVKISNRLGNPIGDGAGFENQ